MVRKRLAFGMSGSKNPPRFGIRGRQGRLGGTSSCSEIGILLPNNQRQHHALHFPKDASAQLA